jgi:hypothetical protein
MSHVNLITIKMAPLKQNPLNSDEKIVTDFNIQV